MRRADDTNASSGKTARFSPEYPPEELNLLGKKVRQVGEGLFDLSFSR